MIVEVGPERFEVKASVAKGAERRRLYDLQATRMPAFEDYEKKTTREIPSSFWSAPTRSGIHAPSRRVFSGS